MASKKQRITPTTSIWDSSSTAPLSVINLSSKKPAHAIAQEIARVWSNFTVDLAQIIALYADKHTDHQVAMFFAAHIASDEQKTTPIYFTLGADIVIKNAAIYNSPLDIAIFELKINPNDGDVVKDKKSTLICKSHTRQFTVCYLPTVVLPGNQELCTGVAHYRPGVEFNPWRTYKFHDKDGKELMSWRCRPTAPGKWRHISSPMYVCGDVLSSSGHLALFLELYRLHRERIQKASVIVAGKRITIDLS